jgi:hypothetical protein
MAAHGRLRLALTVFHSFLRTEATYRRLEEFLARLSVKTIIFQSHDCLGMDAICRPMSSRALSWSTRDLAACVECGLKTNVRPAYLLSN